MARDKDKEKRESEHNSRFSMLDFYSKCAMFSLCCAGANENTPTDDTLSEISTEFFQIGTLTEVVW